jgi:hypothetical protein
MSTTINAEAAQLRAKLLHDFSPSCRDINIIRHELIPFCEQCKCEAWLAGGFVANSDLATDVDLFLFGKVSHKILKAWGLQQGALYHHLEASSFDRFIGRLPSGMPLDVIIAFAGGIQQIVEDFDHPELGYAIEVLTGRHTYFQPGRTGVIRDKRTPLRLLYRKLKTIVRYGIPNIASEEAALRALLVRCTTGE